MDRNRDSRWIAGETHILASRWFAAASVSSNITKPLTLLDTSPHRHPPQSGQRITAAASLLLLLPSTPPETPPTLALRPRPTRTTTAAVRSRRAAAPSRLCRIIPTQYTASLPCLLPRSPLRPRNPPSRPARRQHSYRQSIRSQCDFRCGCLLLCTRIPRSPFATGLPIRRAWKWLVSSVSGIISQRDTTERWLVREVVHNRHTHFGPQPRDVMRSECKKLSPGHRHTY